MLDVIVLMLWVGLGAYGFWFVRCAKTRKPLSLDELVVLWKLHRERSHCGCPISNVAPIIDDHTKEFFGFTCKCGYVYSSEHRIVHRCRSVYDMLSLKPFDIVESCRS